MPEARQDSEVITAGVLTPKEQAAAEYWQKAAANTVPLLSEALGRLVTLNTAFIGGGLVVARAEVLPFWAAAVVLLLQFASLMCAGYGLWPRTAVLDDNRLSVILAFRQRAIDNRAGPLAWSAGLFVLSLVVAFAGVVSKGV